MFGFTCLVIFAVGKVSSTGGAIGLGIAIFFIISLVGGLVPQSYRFLLIASNFAKVTDIDSWMEIAGTNILYVFSFTVLSVAAFRKKEILY